MGSPFVRFYKANMLTALNNLKIKKRHLHYAGAFLFVASLCKR